MILKNQKNKNFSADAKDRGFIVGGREMNMGIILSFYDE